MTSAARTDGAASIASAPAAATVQRTKPREFIDFSRQAAVIRVDFSSPISKAEALCHTPVLFAAA